MIFYTIQKALKIGNKIENVYKFIEVDTKENVLESCKSFIDWVLYTKATLSQGAEKQSFISKIFSAGFYGTYYMFSKKRRIQQVKKTFAKVKINEVKEFLRLVDTSFISSLTSLTFPSIKYNQLIFIPRTEPNLKELFQCGKRMKWGSEENKFDSENIIENEKDKKTKFHTNSKQFNIAYEVQVRLICDIEFPYDFSNEWKRPVLGQDKPEDAKPVQNSMFWISCIGSRSTTEQFVEPIDEIVIHVHGGGFVGMSSNSFQIWTRQWAKDIKMPIFSIDYRLAPENQYPAAVEDWWEAYRWIVLYGFQYLNIKPSKIILVGDSAGGNLICGITILAIQNNFRIPDHLIWAYPGLDFSTNRFYPSLLNGITDIMLNVNLSKHNSWI